MTQAIAHQVTGSGDPLVLLNGGAMTMVQWEPIAIGLAPQFTVIRCDFRGQLLSPGEQQPSLAAHAADVLALLDSLRVSSAHLVGTSFGAFVALMLAGRSPDRVRSVAAIAATDRLEAEDWEGAAAVLEACRAAAAGTGPPGRMFDLLAPVTFTPEYLERNRAAIDARRAMLEMLPPAYFAGHARILEALHGLDLRTEIAAITCPALVLAGGRDLMFPPDRSIRLAAAIASAKLEIVPSAAHGMVVEQPDTVLGALRAFFSGT